MIFIEQEILCMISSLNVIFVKGSLRKEKKKITRMNEIWLEFQWQTNKYKRDINYHLTLFFFRFFTNFVTCLAFYR